MDRVYVMQLVRSFQCGELSRRDFLKRAAAAVGSLAAANLLLAACGQQPATPPPPVIDNAPEDDMAAVTDDGAGLVTESVTYPDTTGAGELMGYLAYPEGAGGLPSVIVIQEWWGLNEHIRDVARRVARQGYVVLAPDLYDGVVTTEPDEARKLVMELDMVNAVREIGEAATYLLSLEPTTGAQVGMMGFCMGGGLTLQATRAFENIGAAVAFYGSPLTPEQAQDVQAPLLGLYGAEDGGISVDEVRAMESGLAEAGITHEIEVYEGAGHAFFNDTRESFDEAAAQDAWARTLAWFETHLAAG